MPLVVIFAAGPVRHMSVRPGPRMGETTDKHGQRPCGPLAWDRAGDWRGRAVTTQRVPLMDLAVKQQASGELAPPAGEHCREASRIDARDWARRSAARGVDPRRW